MEQHGFERLVVVVVLAVEQASDEVLNPLLGVELVVDVFYCCVHCLAFGLSWVVSGCCFRVLGGR